MTNYESPVILRTEELAENQNGNMRTGSVTAGSITVSARKG